MLPLLFKHRSAFDRTDIGITSQVLPTFHNQPLRNPSLTQPHLSLTHIQYKGSLPSLTPWMVPVITLPLKVYFTVCPGEYLNCIAIL